jgi:hypothetical protein
MLTILQGRPSPLSSILMAGKNALPDVQNRNREVGEARS